MKTEIPEAEDYLRLRAQLKTTDQHRKVYSKCERKQHRQTRKPKRNVRPIDKNLYGILLGKPRISIQVTQSDNTYAQNFSVVHDAQKFLANKTDMYSLTRIGAPFPWDQALTN